MNESSAPSNEPKKESWIARQNLALWFAVLFILFSGLFLCLSFGYPYMTKFGIGPGFFPRWVSLVSLVVGVLYLISTFKKNKTTFGEAIPSRTILINVLTVAAAILFFILAAPFIGFNLAAVILLFSIFIREYPWPKAILYSIIVSIIVFLVFYKGFSVPLPLNPFGF